MGTSLSKSTSKNTTKDDYLLSPSNSSYTISNSTSFKINENYFPTAGAAASNLPLGFKELAADINMRYHPPQHLKPNRLSKVASDLSDKL